jgi:hypothetical protein
VYGRDAGEGQKQNIDDMLAAALQFYGERGLLDERPVPLTPERQRAAAATSLRYPGKVASDLPGRRLFISDSSNHRRAPLCRTPSQRCACPCPLTDIRALETS